MEKEIVDGYKRHIRRNKWKRECKNYKEKWIMKEVK
jgi:hypothetical protein